MRKRYQLYITDTPAQEIPQSSVVGEVQCNRKTIAKLLLFDMYVKNCNMREMVVRAAPKPVIIFTTEFLIKLQKEEITTALFAVYHEIGHIVTDNLKKTAEEVRDERRAAIREGRVCDSERKADAFAAKQLGVEMSIMALQEMKAERELQNKEWNAAFKPLNLMALMEYDYRIQELQKLKGTSVEDKKAGI